MHCDDKRTLSVLKEEMVKCWRLLEESGFSDKKLLENFNDSMMQYFEGKSDSE